MRVVFTLNLVTREFIVVDHNVDDSDAPVLALVLTNQDYPAASLDQDCYHLSADAATCDHCKRLIEQRLGIGHD